MGMIVDYKRWYGSLVTPIVFKHCLSAVIGIIGEKCETNKSMIIPYQKFWQQHTTKHAPENDISQLGESVQM